MNLLSCKFIFLYTGVLHASMHFVAFKSVLRQVALPVYLRMNTSGGLFNNKNT